MSRLEQLKTLLQAEPDDVFLRFGLAMEYRKLEQHEEALAEFECICKAHPDYIPGYFQKARLLIDMARSADARDVLTKGVEVAQRTGDQHAAAEMADVLKLL